MTTVDVLPAKQAKVDLYSHHFVIHSMTNELRKLTTRYIRDHLFQTKTMTRNTGEVVVSQQTVFARSTADRSEYRLHINCYADYLRCLANHKVKEDDLDVVIHEMYHPVYVDFNANVEVFKPRSDQAPLVEYLTTDIPIKILNMPPGSGKTLTTFFAINLLKMRSAIILPPKFIDRWVQDMTSPDKFFNLKPGKDILVVRGGKSFRTLLQMALEDQLEAKVIILSNQTLRIYYNHYEVNNRDMDLYHGIHPVDLWKVLGVGFRVTDEIHMFFHQNFVMDLYGHVPTIVGLSATLEPDDQFTNDMTELAYPMDIRRNNGVIEKHVAVKAVKFGLGSNQGRNMIRWKAPGFSAYSHNTFEKTLIKNKPKLTNYITLISTMVKNEYIKKANLELGHCCIVFASSINMCDEIVKILKRDYPDYKVSRYTQEEDYQVLEDYDIIVSTPGSAGTAVDVAGLIFAFATPAISSSPLNIQMFGRLRSIDNLGFDPVFMYLVCEDIPKHLTYHKSRQTLLTPRAKSIQTLETHFSL